MTFFLNPPRTEIPVGPELSNELKLVAKEHVAFTENVKDKEITIESTELYTFRTKTNVYMVNVSINEGLVKNVPVRMDLKKVFSAEEFAALKNKDRELAEEGTKTLILFYILSIIVFTPLILLANRAYESRLRMMERVYKEIAADARKYEKTKSTRHLF